MTEALEQEVKVDVPREAAACLFNGPYVLTKSANDENHIRCSPTGYTCDAVCHEQKVPQCLHAARKLGRDKLHKCVCLALRKWFWEAACLCLAAAPWDATLTARLEIAAS